MLVEALKWEGGGAHPLEGKSENLHDLSLSKTDLNLAEAEARYQWDVERAWRKENRRRLLAEKIVRQQTQALVASLNLAVEKPSTHGFIKALLRAITRECSGLCATYWNAGAGERASGTREINFFSDQSTEEKVMQHAQTQPAEIERYSRRCMDLLKEEPGLTTLKATDRQLPAGLRQLFVQIGAESILLSPLLLGQHLLGWISVACPEPAARIGAGRLAFVEATTHQAALALHLARLSAAERKGALVEERNRIARDMHDLLAQSFSGIILQCEAACAELAEAPPSIAARMEKIRAQAERGMEEVRRSLQMCRPAPLENGSLANALAAMTAETASYYPGKVQFINQTHGETIPPKVETQFFAIATEALHNAVQHAQAHTITLRLKSNGSRLTLSVRDDGKGFGWPPKTASISTRHGLANMRVRAETLPARFVIRTKPGSGTEIRATVDLPNAFEI